jgi:hypothetical protein
VELITYLNTHFFTKQELLDVSKITELELSSYQQNAVMPKCSYKVNLTIQCDSFLGLHHNVQEIEYYAKGYASWLAIVQLVTSVDAVYAVFANRYKAAIKLLTEQGHSCASPKIGLGIDNHIKDEWTHFLNGTYGLCTKTGLPEDIAAKEFAILEINQLSEFTQLTPEQVSRLTKAVNLLDAVSALFAPHERSQSSRHRLVNEVRQKHKLPR